MKKTTLAHFYNKFIVAFICIVGATVNSFGQCPTVTNATQSFCDIQAPAVTNLVAVNNGGGIKWYESSTSTTPLSSTHGLQDGKYYYADDNSGACGTRQRVLISIYGPPGGPSRLGLCVDTIQEATVSDLVASSGNDVQWYEHSSVGNPLSSSTILIHNKYYYVDQANPNTGCRTSRRPVMVTLDLVPVPTGDPIQLFCEDSNSTVDDLVASGTNSWYSTLSSGSPLPLSTPLVHGESYYATTSSPGCESLERLQVTVQIVPVNDAGNSGGEMEICETGLATTPPVNLFDLLWGTPETRGIWSGPETTSNGHIGALDVTNMTAAGSPYVFTYSVSSATCPTSTASVSIIITEGANPGIGGILNLCINNSAQDLFASLKGNPEPGGIWSPAMASTTGVFDPSKDAPGIYTYTVQGVPPCGDATATVEVIVNPEPDAGTNGNLILCFNNGPQDLFSSLGGTPQSGGTWTPALKSGTGVLNPAQDAAGVYTYTVNGVTPCGNAAATVTVGITQMPDPGKNGSLVLCSNDVSQDLFYSLGGTPESGGTWSPALVSGTGVFDPSKDGARIYTYTVNGISPCGPASATVNVSVNPQAQAGTNGNLALCVDSSQTDLLNSLGGTPQPGGTWTPALASGSGLFDPSQDAAGIYTYTISGIAPCGDATATVTVTINPLPNAGSNGSLIICSSDASADLFIKLGGTPQSGGTWSPALASGTGVFNPAQDAAGIYTYTVKGASPCGDATATVEVTINPGVDPGTNGNLNICSTSAPQDLFSSLGGTPQLGGTWSPALVSGTGIFNPLLDASGTYTYTIPGIPPCGDATATVTVTINPLLDPGTNGRMIICKNDSSQDLFNSLGGTPVTGGTWMPPLASGTGFFDPSQDAAGNYTYTVTTNCGQASAIVEVTVHPEAEPGTNGNLAICVYDAPKDLFSSLGGSPQSGGTWSPSLVSGSGIFDPVQDNAGIYTYTVSGITPCSDATATVTVTIDIDPQAGLGGQLVLCSNDAPHNLFESLGGTPETGGIWSPAMASGTGFFDPAQDNAGPYTYTITNACGTDSAIVTVNVVPQPNITGLTLSANNICLEEAQNINLSGATQLLDGNYSLDYSLSGANNTQETISVNIINGSMIITVPASQLTGIGTTTFTILNLLDPITSCGTASGTLPTINFNVDHAPTPQLVNEGDFFCTDDEATIDNLTSNLIGADIITWYDALENGTIYTGDTPLIDGNTYFAENMTIGGCSTGIRLAVTVVIDLCEPLKIIIPDGFSPNGDNINDDFLIKNLRELYPDFKLQIYNRYGNILYKGDTNTPNWNGTSNQGREISSSILPVGVYYYILELKDSNNKTIQGSVYLNR